MIYWITLVLLITVLNMSVSSFAQTRVCDFVKNPPLQEALGERNLLVILWDPDRPGYTWPTREEIRSMIFGEDLSVQDYFEETSYGELVLNEAGFLGPYRRKHQDWRFYWREPGTPYYQHVDDQGFSGGHVRKWVEAIRAADPEFDFSLYDSPNFNGNGDGVLQGNELTVLIVQPAEGSSAGFCRSVVGRQVPSDLPLKVENNTIIIEEIVEAYVKTPAAIGLLAHEISHLAFGAPDMYFECDKEPFEHPYAAENFSLMDNHGQLPHFDPAQKYMYGWITPMVIKRSGTITLHDVETTGEVIRLSRPGYGNREYFLLENRWGGESYDGDRQGELRPIPDQGLAIWHVIEDERLSRDTSLLDPEGVDFAKLSCVWHDWARRGIRLIRPILGYTADVKALWDGKEPDTGYDIRSSQTGDSPYGVDPYGVILRWADGTPSGYEIRNLSPAGKRMTFTVNVPTGCGAVGGFVTDENPEYCDGGDPPTVRHRMHACPLGSYMTGVHLATNKFLCREFAGSYQDFEESIDSNTAEFGMHNCPRGEAMTGFHEANNQLLCAPFPRSNNMRFIDSGGVTQRFGMHACPPDSALTGIHVANNDFTCEQ